MATGSESIQGSFYMGAFDRDIVRSGDSTATAADKLSPLQITGAIDLTERGRLFHRVGELEEPQFLPEVRIFGESREGPRQTGDLPGDKEIGNLEEKEFRAANAPWLKQFKENQPDYEKSLNKAGAHLSEKRTAFLNRMKPGQPDGLEADCERGLEALTMSRQALESSIDGFSGEADRRSAASIASLYIDHIADKSPEAEQDRARILEQMKRSGFSSMIKPLQDYGTQLDKYRPAFQERLELTEQFRDAITNKSNLNDIYGKGLSRAGRVEPDNKSFETRSEQLREENRRLKEESSKLSSQPEFDPYPRLKEPEEETGERTYRI